MATPCWPAPVSAITRVLPIRSVSSAWPSVLLILWAPVWLRSSRLNQICAPPPLRSIAERDTGATAGRQSRAATGPTPVGKPHRRGPRRRRPPAHPRPESTSPGRTARQNPRTGLDRPERSKLPSASSFVAHSSRQFSAASRTWSRWQPTVQGDARATGPRDDAWTSQSAGMITGNRPVASASSRRSPRRIGLRTQLAVLASKALRARTVLDGRRIPGPWRSRPAAG